MELTGKWVLIEMTNIDAYLDAIHSPADFRASLRTVRDGLASNSNSYTLDMTVDTSAMTIHSCVYIDGVKRQDTGTVKFGAKEDATFIDGRPAKVKFVFESDKKVMRYELVDRLPLITSYDTAGDTMTETRNSGKVSCVFKFKKVSG